MQLFFYSLYSKPLYLRLIITFIFLPITLILALLAIPIFIYQFIKLTHKLDTKTLNADYFTTNKEL